MGRAAGGRQAYRAGPLVQRLVCVGVATVVLVACGSSGGNGKVKLAEKRVSDAQQALSDAQSNLTAKSAEFCKSSQSYITALDRYGDVLNQTETTVGDVKDAGTDLQQPSADAISSAEAAVSAQQQVVSAEKDLADAKAELAAAKAATSGQSTTPKTTAPATTVAPLAPSTTVNRVKQAEADFTTAQKAITDQTPLTQASQQFNAAAVALEMSWLRLFADAGCLTDDQQKKAEAAVHDYTAALQKSLADAGYYQGQIDGVYGPATVDAVKALQKVHGLPVTGTVDKATAAGLQADLQAKGGQAAQDAVVSTAAVQQTLKLAGFWNGPVDGNWTPALTEALKAFQTKLGIKPTGAVDAATVAALEHAIATAKAAQASSSPMNSPSRTSSTATTAPASRTATTKAS
jgi:peptidoglycan hydrolase-like protein with peptidoglycan-binding domain